MPQDEIREALRLLEDDLQLGSGFLLNLWAEKDAWVFVIKTHALLETTLTELLGGRLLTPEFGSILALMPMGGRTGKVAFLRAAGLLTPTDQTFLDRFQELRNDLVHTIHNTRFDFQTYLTTHAKKARELGAAAAAFGSTPEVRSHFEQDFATAPQHRVWLVTLTLLARTRSLLLKTDTERQDVQARIRKLFDK